MRLAIRIAAVAIALWVGFNTFNSAAVAEGPAGHWTGKIEAPGQALEFDVDFSRDGEAWKGDISIPAQGTSDLPLTDITVSDAEISFAISGVAGNPTFKGKIDGDTIAGQFTQGQATLPFSMQRATAG